MQVVKISGTGHGQKKMLIEIFLDYIRKRDASGLAFCIYCNKPVSYGSSGKKDILAHARKSPNHLRNKIDYHQSTRLPLSWSQSSTYGETRYLKPNVTQY